MTALMLSAVLLKRFNLLTAGALEAAWVTDFNEKTICGYRKDFLANNGTFKEERRGKYKRLSLFSNLVESSNVGEGTCS